jgi:hypothetical protein
MLYIHGKKNVFEVTQKLLTSNKFFIYKIAQSGLDLWLISPITKNILFESTKLSHLR